MSGKRRWRTGLILLAVTPAMVALSAKQALAHRPESPEVQALVNRGVAFIEKSFGQGSHDGDLGGVCICALACFSHTGNHQHPLVKRAIDQIKKEIASGLPHTGHANYSLGIALILLGSVDPGAYRQETQALLNEVYRRQMSNGAWSYPSYATGDTSQIQFACLGMWMAHRQGISVQIPVVDRVTNWLLRTQAPDGAFGYQGSDPGSFTRVAQERTTASMGVAGTASLYVCGELLGFIEPPTEKAKTNLPAALKQASSKKKSQVTVSTTVDVNKWREAIRDGDNWVNRNANVENFIGGTVAQQYYYMYTQERYWAFRDLTVASASAEPQWYNSGVDYLRKKIATDGSWNADNGATTDTAFAVLFLLRSSKKTLQRIVEESGTVRGGKDLPDDLTDVKQDKSGKIVKVKEVPLVEDLLGMLEDKNAPLSEFLDDMPDQLELAADPAKRAQQIARLRRLAISGPFQSRLTAVKTISRIRDLDNAPPLIFAITDPDPRVSRAAATGLRFLSRKFDGPMPPEEKNEQLQKSIAAVWKEWYLSIRPDGSLIE